MRWINACLSASVFAVAMLASANTFAQNAPVALNAQMAPSAEYNYLLHCGGCHIEDGSGMPPHVPDLRVDMPFFASFPQGREYIARVPGVVQSPMTDEQLTQVLNMILNRFAPPGSDLKPYTVEEVVLYQKEVLLNPQKLRGQLTAHRTQVTGISTGVDSNLDD